MERSAVARCEMQEEREGDRGVDGGWSILVSMDSLAAPGLDCLMRGDRRDQDQEHG